MYMIPFDIKIKFLIKKRLSKLYLQFRYWKKIKKKQKIDTEKILNLTK